MVRQTFHCLIVCLVGCALAISNWAQSSADPRADFLQKVENQAQFDVGAGRAQESTEGLKELFGKEADALGVSLQEVSTVYGTAYKAAKSKTPWWKDFSPNAAWIVALLTFILFLFKETIKKLFSRLLDASAERLYNRLAGLRIFQGTALGKYKKSLHTKNARFKMTFGPDRFLDMRRVYVPLIVSDSNKNLGARIEMNDLEAITAHRRLMVVGVPGSGKSMLLRHLMLSYATDQFMNLTDNPVPVFIKLSDLNTDDSRLEALLAKAFDDNDFPRATNFVEVSLRAGRLLLLFDGLDEVNTDKRQAVVQRIKALIDKYYKCRTVITCRTAVYKDEFKDVVDQTLELAPFNDKQIRSFLEAWPEMPTSKSIEQLLLTLRDRPQIMRLARNPLLLTIIAFLYSDTEQFELPYSRTEFYDRATDFLLGLKGEYNKFKTPQKALVLQHLALFNQDGGTHNHQDKLSIELPTVLKQIKLVLPELGISEDRAPVILDEIEQRSGLLMAIDNGVRYQFTHLTLQEYFAAAALRNNPQGLLQRFKLDQDAWRETVKLWCGFDHESTEMIQAIYNEDRITAFECLADALRVKQPLADEIINNFKPRLGASDSSDELVTRAFAAVASGPPMKVQEVFNFLAETLRQDASHTRRMAAATALSQTNKLQAVKVLIEQYEIRPEVKPALVWLGDLAVPMLSDLATAGDASALDVLADIGTPEAANELARWIWHANIEYATKAASLLAGLLSNGGVEEALRSYPLAAEDHQLPKYDWVWQPFSEPTSSSLPVIAGRMALLIDEYVTQHELVTKNPIDDRIIIALTVKVASSIPTRQRPNIRAFLEKHLDLEEHLTADTIWAVNMVLDPSSRESTVSMARLLALLESRKQSLVLRRLFSPIQPSVFHWMNLFRPVLFEFRKSVYHLLIILLIAFLYFLFGSEVYYTFKTSAGWFNWNNALISLGALILIGGTIGWVVVDEEPVIINLLRGPWFLYYEVFEDGGLSFNDLSEFIGVVIGVLLFAGFAPTIFYFDTRYLLRTQPMWRLILFWVIYITLLAIVATIGFRKNTAAENPLHGILNDPERESSKTIFT